MARTHILGFPRIGAHRELKFAQESLWRGESDEAYLLGVGEDLRRRHWELQRVAKLDFVTVGDFAYYDQMLNMSALLGALPARFEFDPASLSLLQYYELARGNKAQPAMEMTKWFDTNYHYLVPELGSKTSFDGGIDWFFDEIDEALAKNLPVKRCSWARSHTCICRRVTRQALTVSACCTGSLHDMRRFSLD